MDDEAEQAGVRTVAVVGLGTAGAALARRCADAGLRTIGVTEDAADADRARRELAGTGTEVTCALDTVAAADVVIEAVPERAAAKRAVLAAVAAHRAPGTPVLTTALTLTAAELAAASGGPGLQALRFVRADRLTAVELARAPGTPERHTAVVLALLHRLGLRAHQVPDLPGSIAPVLLFALLNQAAWMHEEGHASAAALDTAVRLGCGWPDGPLRTLDAIGLDTALDVLDGLHGRLGPRFEPPPGMRKLVAQGALGAKTGRGYACGNITATPAPTITSAPIPGIGPVVVIGSGTMATGIGEVFLRGGYRTVLLARTPEKAAAADEAVRFGLERTAASGPDPAEAMTRWTATADRSALGRAGLVIEAVVEDPAVKRDLFAELGAVCAPGTLLATTTSSLPVGECGTASGRPADVVGLHFFNPAPAMPLVELVRAAGTGEPALATARRIVTGLGKTPVECADRTGFLVNALLFPYLNDALGLLEDGAVGPALLDAAVKSVGGQPIGPTRLLDTVGADVALTVARRLYEQYGRRPEFAPAPLLERLVDGGFLGRKSAGRGLRAYLTEAAATVAA
ncbi:3-hydroxyacyl-CoA dehydrogenase NAD-binding domain-containing protein [Streptomyces ochraceiscleroticus]|uniref:3-hydroxyacyl-CoA dehydrogenase NAD-binding domain-containing protein n=1 Tax=Streptomyces ochraceiscleroticus TaxID=47761 RepID=A0ABW1MHC5_9ACTN|nr:3-hydroxyacyl-CoA dehydrogenase NAD-binding domain-containing protein [Streptomyces ochraceiscleroticus]